MWLVALHGLVHWPVVTCHTKTRRLFHSRGQTFLRSNIVVLLVAAPSSLLFFLPSLFFPPLLCSGPWFLFPGFAPVPRDSLHQKQPNATHREFYHYSMLSTRNVRVVLAAILLFTVVSYLAVSLTSFSESVQRVKPAVQAENAVDEEAANTFQGTPHKGTEAPYKATGASVEKPDKGFNADKGVTVSQPSVVAKPGQVAKPDQVAKPKPVAGEKCERTDYVVMIDAGLTGSRVHVYAFDTCVSPPALLKEKFEMLKPGLSSFDTDTKGAATSLDPLLKVALDTVPKEKQSCTPVAVKATAGLRLLGQAKSDAILAEVRRHLETDYPFAVVDGNGVSIMDGKDEGVYAWITANYLLGNIGTNEKTPTAAVFDLGGGSTQIVFEPELGDTEVMADGDHKYQFTFGSRDFSLYQTSHLGYGLMQGRNKVNALVVDSALKNNVELTKYTSRAAAKEAKASVTINNPCMAPGVTATDVQVEVSDDEVYVVSFTGPKEATGAQCRYLAEKVLNMDAECKSKPCSFNGVYQPLLRKAFHKDSDMYVFSYFYDRTNPLGFPSSFTVEELRDLTKTVCAGEPLWKDVLLGDSLKGLQEEPHWCLDLSFITAMLHTGYNIPLNRELKTAKTIASNELGWCLGASLPLLDPKEGGWKCRVKETTSQ